MVERKAYKLISYLIILSVTYYILAYNISNCIFQMKKKYNVPKNIYFVISPRN